MFSKTVNGFPGALSYSNLARPTGSARHSLAYGFLRVRRKLEQDLANRGQELGSIEAVHRKFEDSARSQLSIREAIRQIHELGGIHGRLRIKAKGQ